MRRLFCERNALSYPTLNMLDRGWSEVFWGAFELVIAQKRMQRRVLRHMRDWCVEVLALWKRTNLIV